MLDRLIAAYHAFIDQVVIVIAHLLAQVRGGGALCAREAGDGLFLLPASGCHAPFRLGPDEKVPDAVAAALAGRSVELVLAPDRVLFCPMDLPPGAAAYLDGIVRAQIDRLTPWSAADAAFGHGPPEPMSDGRIGVLVAATARARLMPLVAALKAHGARAVTILADAPPAQAIRLLDDGPAAAGGDRRTRQVLHALLGVAVVSAAVVSIAADRIGAGLDAELAAVRQGMDTERRHITAARSEGEGASALALERRKRETPSSVLLLEALSDILPDDTYVTELRLAEDRVEISGLSREAPGLIRRLEQSKRFAEATFSAPTLRQPGEKGERFQIGARILMPQGRPR